MKPTLPGIHHVTAITADAQQNLDFYCGVLGLRMVKLTVNFDDPKSYHLYYGDASGRPGSIMTFFAWAGARRGQVGTPQVTATAFAAPKGSLAYWGERLREKDVAFEEVGNCFGETLLGFNDPDGMRLEIVAASETHADHSGPVPHEHAIQGFHGVTISGEGHAHTARLLTETMGFRAEGSEGNRFRYRAGTGSYASIVDLVCAPDARHGSMGAGVVHHVAFRTPDDAQQAAWRAELTGLGFNISPVMDRSYFHSIYFREPGGVLFEIATDVPGFATDESPDGLGTRLQLPAQYEEHRQQLEKLLPPLRLPQW